MSHDSPIGPHPRHAHQPPAQGRTPRQFPELFIKPRDLALDRSQSFHQRSHARTRPRVIGSFRKPMTNVEHIPARKLYVRKKPQGDHRPKGSQDRFTREIKQGIVEAARVRRRRVDRPRKSRCAARHYRVPCTCCQEPSANNVRNARSHDADPKRNDAVRQRHNPAWVKGHPGASRLFAYREFSSGDVDVLDVCHLFLKQLKPTPGVSPCLRRSPSTSQLFRWPSRLRHILGRAP